MESAKGEKRAEPAPNQSIETVSNKSDFISQIETAFAKHLPADANIDTFIEKIVDAYLISPPPQKYNDDFFLDIIKPVILRIIRLKEDLEKKACEFNELLTKKDSAKALLCAQDSLRDIGEEIDDILDCYDVTSFKVEGGKFNPLKQTVVKTIPTQDEAFFKIVAESRSCGYERNGRVISKERVAAYVIEKAKEQEA